MDKKVFLITGVTGAIGGAIARKLDSLGATLILTGRDTKKVEIFIDKELTQSNHIVLKLDLEDIDSISKSIDDLLFHDIRIDGFVHASGVGEVRPLKMTTPKFIYKVMNINFTSFIEIIRCIVNSKFKNKKISIVGISAIGAFQGNSTKTAYCASKAAMNAAVRCLAIELGDKGIRINTVAPGATQSKMMDDILSLPGGEQTLDKIKERQFLGVCSPNDIADAIHFLLSDSSKMITGTCLAVDGGKLST
ncbi:MAG: Short-chain reductase protein NovJ [Bacteroidota bacterium]|jgi:NAD(P)-dependent dehydrogenase (short-subunit alcohol dehydrogenase family)